MLVTAPSPFTLTTDYQSIDRIIFDLDGTLYNSVAFGKEIETSALRLFAQSRALPLPRARILLEKARKVLQGSRDTAPSLTATYDRLGITPQELHEAINAGTRPERHLEPDLILRSLLESLQERATLYIYTNNNLLLTRKILALLDVDTLFERIFSIEYRWIPKPDPRPLDALIDELGGGPENYLFVGDRHEIDLALPAERGIATLLVQEVADLLRIHQMLGIIP